MAKNNAFGYNESEMNSSWFSGVGEFTFNENQSKVKVVVTDRKGKSETFKFSAKLLPDVPKEIDPDEEYGISLRLDDDGDVEEVETIYPANWMGEIVKPVDISKQDDLPTPITIEGKSKGGGDYSYQMFIVHLEMQEGEFKGATIPYWLKYAFMEREDGMTQFSGNPDNPKATRVRECVNFCVHTGCVEEDIEWPDDGNILPELWARIEDRGALLNTSGKDGQIETVLPAENAKPEKEEKKKKNKKSKAKKADDDFDDDEF